MFKKKSAKCRLFSAYTICFLSEPPPPIIQNFDFVELPVKVLDRSAAYITGQAFKSIFYVYARLGPDGLINLINERAKNIYNADSATASYTEISLRVNLERMLSEEGLTIDQLPGLVQRGSQYYLKERVTNKAIGEAFGMFGEQYFHFCTALLKKDYKKAYELLTINESDNEKIIEKLLSLIL